MITSLGFIRSQSQILIQDFNWQTSNLSSRLIDVTDLEDENLQGIFLENGDHFNSLSNLLEKEKAYYPVIDARFDAMTIEHFESTTPQQFRAIYTKHSARWALTQNMNSIENFFQITNHFRDLWKKERLTFFEELWYWMKRNIPFSDLTIYFNDIITSEENDENNEKRDRPKLTQSFLTGFKKAHFQNGGAREKELMNTYLEKFHDVFEITEFDLNKGRFVATAQIERSPMIIMGHTAQINQIQRALPTGLFNGLQI